MTLRQQLDDQLAQLHPLSQGSAATLQLSLPHGQLECELVALDTIACAFLHFTYETDRLAGATLAQLRQLSQSLCERLRYLLEPIHPIEVDDERCQVQMRSVPPQKDEDGSSYYELVIERGGSIRLCRYNKAAGQPRSVIPANVTREVLYRLTQDFSATV